MRAAIKKIFSLHPLKFTALLIGLFIVGVTIANMTSHTEALIDALLLAIDSEPDGVFDYDTNADGYVDAIPPDNIVGDTYDDNLLAVSLLSWLTDGDARNTAPSVPEEGLVYKTKGIGWDPNSLSVDYTASTIAWVSGTPATITDSANGFVTAGYKAGMLFYSATSENNTGIYHIASVVAGTITFASGETVTSESSGSSEILNGCYQYLTLYDAAGNYKALLDAGGTWYYSEVQLPGHETNDASLDALGKVFIKATDDAIALHMGAAGEVAGEVQISVLEHFKISFDPKVVCDGTIDRLFLFTVGDDAPNGIIIDEWKLSFEADPTTEFGAGETLLKYADAFIGVANAVTIDDLATTAGVAAEDTDSNINSGSAVANTKVVYLDFPTAYTETGHQCIFEMWYHAEED